MGLEWSLDTLRSLRLRTRRVENHPPEGGADTAHAARDKASVRIAVVDAGGNLKIFARQDGAFLGSIDIAQKKAKTARYFNMSTAELGASAQPGKELFGIEVTNNGLAIFGGGELLVRGGIVVGAIGVSGGSVVDDTTVAKAGAAALQQSSNKSSF